MDLNYLLSRHQISLERSHHAAGIEAQRAHASLATHYATRIDALRRTMFPKGDMAWKLETAMPHGAA